MTKVSTSFATTARRLICAAAFGLALSAFSSAGYAYTAEQRQACTPDAFRLCSSEIPNISAITACMRRQKASLSPACKAVFDK